MFRKDARESIRKGICRGVRKRNIKYTKLPKYKNAKYELWKLYINWEREKLIYIYTYIYTYIYFYIYRERETTNMFMYIQI